MPSIDDESKAQKMDEVDGTTRLEGEIKATSNRQENLAAHVNRHEEVKSNDETE